MLEFSYLLNKLSYAGELAISLGLWRAESYTPCHLVLQQSLLDAVIRTWPT